MFRILSSRHDVSCLTILLSVGAVLVVGQVNAQSVYTIPNSRYVQAGEEIVEKADFKQSVVGRDVLEKDRTAKDEFVKVEVVESQTLKGLSVKDEVAAGKVAKNEVAKEKAVKNRIKKEETIPAVSLVSLIESGQFLPPSAPELSVDTLPATGTQTLDLPAAVRQAMTSYPDIKRAHEGVSEQLQRVEVARAGYYPRVSGGVRSGYQSGVPGGSSAQVFDLNASQMLYDFGKVSSAVEASQAGVTERRAEARLSVEQVAMNTALAFLDGQYYQRLIAITQDQIDNLEKISSLARQRLDMGASTRSDYVQTVSRIEAAKVTGFQYQANLARTFATLSNLTGQSRVDGVSDYFPRELEQSCQQVDTDMQDNPEVQSAQARVTRAQAEVTAASAAGLPTLSLESTFTRQLDGYTGADQDRNSYSVFLNASMPIYQGGAIQAGKAASERALASSQAGLDTARLRARQDMQQAKSQVLQLHASLGAQTVRERTINETRTLYRQQYLELGTRPLLDLLNAEQEAYASRIEQQTTLNNLRRLQINCLYSAGHLSRSFGAASDDAYRERLP
nr:TolC family outer membrane protein [Pseudomonas aeruginosa]